MNQAVFNAGDFEVRHSAIQGQGLFTLRFIPSRTRLLPYLGREISKAESLRLCQGNNPYIFQIGPDRDLDGNIPENLARWINHSCAPNCEAVLESDGLWIISLLDIQAGEELCFNYGYDLEDYRDYPCACQSPDCVGYMVAEEFFPKLRPGRES